MEEKKKQFRKYVEWFIVEIDNLLITFRLKFPHGAFTSITLDVPFLLSKLDRYEKNLFDLRQDSYDWRIIHGTGKNVKEVHARRGDHVKENSAEGRRVLLKKGERPDGTEY